MLNIGALDAFFIVAGLASLVVFPSLVWNLIGALIRRPRVRLQFDRTDDPNGAVLLGCEIINDSIYSRPLTFLGIKRDGFDEVHCRYAVFSATTNETILADNLAVLHDDKGGHHDSAPLPANFHGLNFAVAIMTMEGGGVAIIRNSAGVGQIVAPDTYRCRMFVHADELHIRVYEHDLLIGVDQDHFQWMGECRRIK